MADITNSETTPALLEDQSSSRSSELASNEQPSNVSESSVLTKACQSLEEVKKVLTVEEKQHIGSTEVKLSYKGCPRITSSGCRAKSWELNYPAIAFMLNGGYYNDYATVMGTMGLPVMHHSTWENLVSWVGPHVEQLAEWSCEQVRVDIEKRGDHLEWMAGFDGFYLTRGHHSNNSSATLHDVYSDRIAWFAHRTKRGKDSNWEGTSSGAEGDMLSEILGKVKDRGFTINQLVMDHDTSANAIVCSHFPDVHITYCGNHTAKSFHYELGKIKALKCKCKTQGIPCKRITESFIDRVKRALRNLMSCAEVLEDSKPLEAFSEGLLNFYSHYCKDSHDSKWCKFHSKTSDDGGQYTTKSPLLCPVQSEAFEDLLKAMAAKPQEYITTTGKVTTNAIEGFHGLALKYRGKRTDLLHTHYCCKTNMAVCHKNLGPIWKIICLCEMGVDIPEVAVSVILKEQELWSKKREKRNQSDYYQKRNLLKQRASQRHAAEKEHMVTLRAVGCTTAEYVGSSMIDAPDSVDDDVDDEEPDDEDETTAGDCDPPTDDCDLPTDDNEMEDSQPSMLPLMFFYDCESTGGSIYEDHIIEVGAKVVAAPCSTDISQLEYSSLIHSSRIIVKAVQDKCGISARMLVTKPPFLHVFEELLSWISGTIKIVDKIYELQDVKYYPVLVAHNGFVFDFLILLSELHRRNIPFNRLTSINLHFADTFYDCKKLVKSNSAIFTNWTSLEKKRLGINNLYNKIFPEATYDAHRALEDVRAMEKLFTSTAFVSILSSLTIWNSQQLLQAWNDKTNKNNRVQQIVRGFKLDCTKRMAQRLELLGLSYTYLKEQYEGAKSTEEFVKWLKSVGVNYKVWHEKFACTLKV